MEQNDATFTPDYDDYEVIYRYAADSTDVPIDNWTCHLMSSAKAERMFTIKAGNSTKCAIEKMMRITK